MGQKIYYSISFLLIIFLLIATEYRLTDAQEENKTANYEANTNTPNRSHALEKNLEIDQSGTSVAVEDFNVRDFKHPKIDSKTIRMQKQMGVAMLQDATVDPTIRVKIQLVDDDPAHFSKLKELGINTEVEYKNFVQALVPYDKIEELSQQDFIVNIRQPDEATLENHCPLGGCEGARTIGAYDVQISEGLTGLGIDVAVIDSGFDLSNPHISSNYIFCKSHINGGTFPCNQPEADHGTSVAEIILDVAPQVNLYLYAVATQLEAISALNDIITNEPDMDIVSMSLGFFFDGPGDGTGDFALLVDNARFLQDMMFIKSAGNYALSHWEGGWSNPDDDNFHNFLGADETLEVFAISGDRIRVELEWHDWPSSMQDYDLLLFNDSFFLVDFSNNLQSPDIGGRPYESINYLVTTSGFHHIVIQRDCFPVFCPNPVYFELFSRTHAFREGYNIPSGSLSLPGDAAGSTTVGAMHYSGDVVEDFSSRGPTDDFRIKPDISAPDGVTTTFYGSGVSCNPNLGGFCGTSAAAPHVAGAAALVMEANPALSASSTVQILEENTQTPHVKNNLEGTGRLDVRFLLPPDKDGDGIPDGSDNCEDNFNPTQEDLDVDGIGDACDDLHLFIVDTTVSETFTILQGQSAQIEPGVAFVIDGQGIVNNDSDLTINNFGNMIIIGTLNNAGSFINHPGALITNTITGTINNNGGTIINMAGAAIVNANGATIENNNAATITNEGGAFLLNTGSSSTINNNAGGTIVGDAGTIIFNQGTSTFTNNGGTINLSGGLVNSGGSTLNNAGGTITSNGVIISQDAGSSIINTGIITNNAAGLLINFLSATITNNPSGTITINPGGIILNSASGTIDNSGGTITSSGAVLNSAGSTINNNSGGAIGNAATFFISPGTALNNNAGSNFNNNAGGILFNLGATGNGGTITNNNGANLFNIGGGVLTNLSGGLITNNLGGTGLNGESSTLNNNAGATIDNDNGGQWFNECDGIVINDGVLFGTIVDIPCA